VVPFVVMSAKNHGFLPKSRLALFQIFLHLLFSVARGTWTDSIPSHKSNDNIASTFERLCTVQTVHDGCYACIT